MSSRPKLSHQNSGLLLIEILLAVALMGIITLTILSAFLYGRESIAVAGDRLQAAEIANETVDALQNIAHDSYANLAGYNNGTNYYLDDSGSQWAVTTSATVIDSSYTPMIVFSAGPGAGRQATITVSWQTDSQRGGAVTVTTYFTDWQAATSFLRSSFTPLQRMS